MLLIVMALLYGDLIYSFENFHKMLETYRKNYMDIYMLNITILLQVEDKQLVF